MWPIHKTGCNYGTLTSSQIRYRTKSDINIYQMVKTSTTNKINSPSSPSPGFPQPWHHEQCSGLQSFHSYGYRRISQCSALRGERNHFQDMYELFKQEQPPCTRSALILEAYLWRRQESGQWAAPAPWQRGSACHHSHQHRCSGTACEYATPSWGSPSSRCGPANKIKANIWQFHYNTNILLFLTITAVCLAGLHNH